VPSEIVDYKGRSNWHIHCGFTTLKLLGLSQPNEAMSETEVIHAREADNRTSEKSQA
jgi:hypothetical protein